MKKNDFILIAVLILISSLIILSVNFFSKKGLNCVVKVDGKTVNSYSLLEDLEVTVSGYNNLDNVLEIKNGEAFVSHALCPDGLCVKQGKISKTGQTIVCLPNRVVIEITGEDRAEVDFVSK